ncbi:hypothetical protein PIB30_099133 [Stylosanthes scabra]|uniref:Uncharacterized protein n=1 Tax=Stylosanthes scabra TaxID=79078 RepID=A0ABU6YV09_9FABA|nr:hypothetical protein [Stylosanthes scabra]
MIVPANVCAHNHHKRASEGNGAAAERPRGAHLLAMAPRASGCPTRRSRASGTRVGGRKDGAGMIAPGYVCAHNHHKRASEGNGAAAERHRGAHLLAIEPRPSGCPTRQTRASRMRVCGRKDSAGMIAPANVCAHNHHNRASEGNGAVTERPRGAHLLAMEPRPSGCPTRRTRASRTRVYGRKDSASMIAPANVCAHNHHRRASEGNAAAAEMLRGAHLLAMEPRPSGYPTRRSRVSGTRVGGRKEGEKRGTEKEVQHEDFRGGPHPSTTLAQARLTEEF